MNPILEDVDARRGVGDCLLLQILPGAIEVLEVGSKL